MDDVWPSVQCRWYMAADADATYLLTGWTLPIPPSRVDQARGMGVPLTEVEDTLQRFWCAGSAGDVWIAAQVQDHAGWLPVDRLVALHVVRPAARAKVRTSIASMRNATEAHLLSHFGAVLGSGLRIGVIPLASWSNDTAEEYAAAAVAEADQAAEERGARLRTAVRNNLYSVTLSNAKPYVQEEREALFVRLISSDPQQGGLAVVGTQFVHLALGEFVLVEEPPSEPPVEVPPAVVEDACEALDGACNEE